MTDYYAPTEDDIAFVRRVVGSGEPPTDDDLYDAIQEAGSAALAAQNYIEARLGDLLSGPASFSVPGYSESNSATISVLESKLAELRILTGTSINTVKTVDVFRSDRQWR